MKTMQKKFIIVLFVIFLILTSSCASHYEISGNVSSISIENGYAYSATVITLTNGELLEIQNYKDLAIKPSIGKSYKFKIMKRNSYLYINSFEELK